MIFNVLYLFWGAAERFRGTPERFKGTPEKFLSTPERFPGTPKKFRGTAERFKGIPKRFRGKQEFFLLTPKSFKGASITLKDCYLLFHHPRSKHFIARIYLGYINALVKVLGIYSIGIALLLLVAHNLFARNIKQGKGEARVFNVCKT